MRKQLRDPSHQVVPGERHPPGPGHGALATIFRQDVTKGLAEVCGSLGGQRRGTRRVRSEGTCECVWLPPGPTA